MVLGGLMPEEVLLGATRMPFDVQRLQADADRSANVAGRLLLDDCESRALLRQIA